MDILPCTEHWRGIHSINFNECSRLNIVGDTVLHTYKK